MYICLLATSPNLESFKVYFVTSETFQPKPLHKCIYIYIYILGVSVGLNDIYIYIYIYIIKTNTNSQFKNLLELTSETSSRENRRTSPVGQVQRPLTSTNPHHNQQPDNQVPGIFPTRPRLFIAYQPMSHASQPVKNTHSLLDPYLVEEENVFSNLPISFFLFLNIHLSGQTRFFSSSKG